MPPPKLHKRQMHGLSGIPEYNNWQMMRNRCCNPKSEDYPRWGGKGIKVCKRWLEGENGVHPFVCFLADMGNRPTPKHEVDRYPNNDGNYEPGNVRWALPSQQGWSKVGKPRPDLSAFNKARLGVPLTKKHRANISASQIGLKKAPYKNKGFPIDPAIVAKRIGKKRGPYHKKGE
jgi:hypothetical protein